MKTLPHTIDDLEGPGGQSFWFTDDGIYHACRSCDVRYPQTDDGWLALRDHEFEEHERIRHYDWTELHGQEVTILIIQREDPQYFSEKHRYQTELVARTKDGTYYFLPFSHYDAWDAGDFKWKPKRDGLALLQTTLNGNTPSGRGSLLLGSDDTGGSSGPATTRRRAAKDGSPSTDKRGKKISDSADSQPLVREPIGTDVP
jgi:hypothetical protein